MLTDERYEYILAKLNERGTVKSQDLIDSLDTSESTIRRDLANLEAAGKLQRIHGGAKRLYQLQDEMDMTEKSSKSIQKKEKIALHAVKKIQPKDTIYLDAGSTTFQMIPLLQGMDITVVTNGIQHAGLLADYQIPTLLLGGQIKFSTKAIVGATSLKELMRYQFDKAFLGINGIHSQYGLTTPDTEEAVLKNMALQQSNQPFFLADSSKFNEVNFCQVANMQDTHIITDQIPESYQHFSEIEEAK